MRIPRATFSLTAFRRYCPRAAGVLFTMVSGSDAGQSRIAILDPEGGVHVLLQGGLYGRYAASGHLLYATDDSIYAVGLDLTRYETVGAPVRVVADVRPIASYGLAPFAVSEEGTLAYVPVATLDALTTTLVAVDRQGRSERLPFEPKSYVYPSLSPDGDSLVVNVEKQIHVLDLNTSRSKPLATVGTNFHPIWTADGESVVYLSDRQGVWALYRQSVRGTDDPVPLSSLEQGGDELTPTSVSADGLLAVRRDSPGQGYEIGSVELATGGSWQPLVTGAGLVSNAQFSPDGRFVAFEIWVDAIPQIFVEPFPPSGQRWLVTAGSGRSPRWSRAADELFYVEGDGRIMVVPYRWEKGTFVAAEPDLLFEHPILDPGGGGPLFDVTPDGQRFLLIEAQNLSRGEIVVVENWFAELEGLVPAN